MLTKVDSATLVSTNGEETSTSSGTGTTSDSKKDKIKVVVRLRPVTGKINKRSVIAVDDKSILLEEKGNFPDICITDVKRKKFYDNQYFSFDAVFSEDASQEDVYNVTAKCFVHDVIAGYNGMIFAYGATGSGKTYTMMAINYDNYNQINYSKCGIVLQTFRDLFSIIEEQKSRFIVTLSYMEIYNENIKDLFNTESGCLELRGNNNLQIIGLSELVVTSSEQAISLLKKGNDIRSVRYTGANSASSRSHTILIIVLRRTSDHEEYNNFKSGTRQSKLLFVDLAGSERAKHTKNKGLSLQEGGHINKSLLALGNCISALSNGTKVLHVNFRDSKLTRLLREPLSGNYRTAMIAQINPACEFREDIKNTLIFATKAMGISRRVMPNTVSSLSRVPRYQNLIAELRDEVTRLKSKIKDHHEKRPNGRAVHENHKAKKLRDQIISTFEERIKLRQQLYDVDNHILSLNSEAEKQNQIISHWQSKNNKLYRWRNSAMFQIRAKENNNSSIRDNINGATAVLNSIETEQEELARLKNDLVEKSEHLREKAISLENELHVNLDEDTEKELLRLFCRVHELEADKLTLQGERMTDIFELRRSKDLISRYQDQQIISDNIITRQRQLIEENKINIPVDLKTLYKLYQEEIHVTTLRHVKNINLDDIDENNSLPFLKGIERDPVRCNDDGKKKISNTSSGSNDDSDTNELEDKSYLRLPRVYPNHGIEVNNSRNPSPIPAAVLFPPITF